jgi:hypothetical protein
MGTPEGQVNLAKKCMGSTNRGQATRGLRRHIFTGVSSTNPAQVLLRVAVGALNLESGIAGCLCRRATSSCREGGERRVADGVWDASSATGRTVSGRLAVMVSRALALVIVRRPTYAALSLPRRADLWGAITSVRAVNSKSYAGGRRRGQMKAAGTATPRLLLTCTTWRAAVGGGGDDAAAVGTSVSRAGEQTGSSGRLAPALNGADLAWPARIVSP